VGEGVIRPQIKNRVIALLCDSSSSLSQRQIAEITGVSLSYVSQVYKELRPSLQDAQDRLLQYQRHIDSQINLERRSELLAGLAKEADKDMVRLCAIKYLDELDGIVTAKARKETEKDHGPTSFFIFPPGSEPIINLGAQDTQSDALEAEARVITEDEEIETEGSPAIVQSDQGEAPEKVETVPEEDPPAPPESGTRPELALNEPKPSTPVTVSDDGDWFGKFFE
jgi:transcriptional regulator with XRE-family HTH domain